jgi:hypothetical protein
MSEHFDEESPQSAPPRLRPFHDCLAFLLAKRWLRDQRQQEKTDPPQQPLKRRDESSEK